MSEGVEGGGAVREASPRKHYPLLQNRFSTPHFSRMVSPPSPIPSHTRSFFSHTITKYKGSLLRIDGSYVEERKMRQ